MENGFPRAAVPPTNAMGRAAIFDYKPVATRTQHHGARRVTTRGLGVRPLAAQHGYTYLRAQGVGTAGGVSRSPEPGSLSQRRGVDVARGSPGRRVALLELVL
ncbi:hypothetical protein GCM10018987_18910 [Streptomyces cremeus]